MLVLGQFNSRFPLSDQFPQHSPQRKTTRNNELGRRPFLYATGGKTSCGKTHG
jgi:hypothetical protein